MVAYIQEISQFILFSIEIEAILKKWIF